MHEGPPQRLPANLSVLYSMHSMHSMGSCNACRTHNDTRQVLHDALTKQKMLRR